MAMINIINICWCLSALVILTNQTGSDTWTLLQTHVVFRHGERTTYRFYPTDPHANMTFYPTGLGSLTNNGKMGEYKLGQFLRQRYDDMLGDYYTNDELEVRSTNTERTIMSAQLVLAGMYPPQRAQIWNPALLWQPIPVFSKRREEEDLLHPEICPKKLAVYENLPRRTDVHEIFIKPYEKLFKYVEEKSGMPIRNPHDLIEFFFIVDTEDDLKLELPAWVRKVYPEQIYPVASLAYAYLNVDMDIRKINSGYLMKKIINDTQRMVDGGKDARSMYLYSGHESTLGFLLLAMDVLKPHIPVYGSAIMIELYVSKDHEYAIKLKYRENPEENKTVDLILPGCDGRKYCPLNKFIELQAYYLPTQSVTEACRLKTLAPASWTRMNQIWLDLDTK